ncbi:LysR family transcriptional regulator [Rhodobacteraceae bacterium CCMM004]|nr:LysR family transcriptional regulator [Rhodobacteraceae bacterium CCMM004]
MNWDDLRMFLAVARSESLSAAGRRLQRDPATVGRRVARLEAALGAALFLKSPQGYALTDAGARLMVRASEAEAALAGAAEDLAGEDSLSGTVRIGAPDGCANFVLPQVTAQLRAAHPGLEIQIVALPRVFDLCKREADLAVAVSRPETGRLVSRRIADYRLHLAAADTYLAAAPPLAVPEDLARHPIVGYVPEMIFDRELDYLAEAGLGRVDLASNSVSVQGQWLRAGAGVGIVHDFMLPFLPGVRAVLADRVTLLRTFWLVRHADDRRTGRLGRLADLLVEGMRAEIRRLCAEA